MSIRPQGRLRSDSGDAILHWAEAGLGIALLPSFILADAIKNGRLEPLLMDFPAPELGIYVVRPPGVHVSRKVRVFIEALAERFGGKPDWDRCLMAARERRE